MIFVVAYQLALLLPHSARNWNILVVRKTTNNKLRPCWDAQAKKMRKRRGKKKQKQKYTFYYRLHYKFFSIIHPADEWLILLQLPDGVSLPFECFRKQFREDKATEDNILVFYSDNKYMNGSSKQTTQRTYLSFFLFHNHARLNQSIEFLSPQSPSEFTNLRPL